MKITEGYWRMSERANVSFAAQAYRITEIPGGMRVQCPSKKIRSRADTQEITVLILDFQVVEEGIIRMSVTHYRGYDKKVPVFVPDEKWKNSMAAARYTVSVDEKEAMLRTDLMAVRILRDDFLISFETADGKVLTTCGQKNLAYVRWDRKPLTYLPADNYLSCDYKPYIKMELSINAGETVYGLGERFTPFVRNGQSLDTWNEDGGTTTQVTYKAVPFYMTSEGYGLMVDSSDNVSFEVGSEKVEYISFSVPGETMVIYMFCGPSPAEISRRYTGLTGRSPLLPAWSFGLWLSSSFKPEYDEKIVNGYLDGMEKYNIPLSVFHFDPYWMKALNWCELEWDSKVFPDVEGMLKRYHKRGIRVCLWINPYIAQETEMFREGMENGFFVMRGDGRGIWQTDDWQPGMAIVDFTNPAAREWFSLHLEALLRAGVDVFKTDFGERIPIDAAFFDGTDPHAMHNYYTCLYNRTVYEAICRVKGKENAVLFARSATVGGQQFPVHWGGDCYANYPSMAETLRGGLSFSMSGFSYWSHDISGFESTATPDLYKRWCAFGLFSSHSRLHGADTSRVPWLFDEESCYVLSFFTRLKMRLMPYIYEAAVTASEIGTPLMRPMFFAYPDDLSCRYLDMQYMFGDSLLVAPIFNEKGEGSCYLPAGKWTHLLDGTVVTGEKWYRNTYDYYSLPLFVKENTLLPFGAYDNCPDYDYTEDLTLKFYQPLDDVPAYCRIVDSHGKYINTFTALLRASVITITSDRPAKAATLEVILDDSFLSFSVQADVLRQTFIVE